MRKSSRHSYCYYYKKQTFESQELRWLWITYLPGCEQHGTKAVYHVWLILCPRHHHYWIQDHTATYLQHCTPSGVSATADLSSIAPDLSSIAPDLALDLMEAARKSLIQLREAPQLHYWKLDMHAYVGHFLQSSAVAWPPKPFTSPQIAADIRRGL
jgi:hypothetical protein